jgi:hypothetical protein
MSLDQSILSAAPNKQTNKQTNKQINVRVSEKLKAVCHRARIRAEEFLTEGAIGTIHAAPRA